MHHRPVDLVERTQHTLDRLESKLNLTEDQQSAWKTYADSTIARAKERAATMEAHYTGKGSSNIDLDTASKMEKMVQAMRTRADRLQKVAQEMRALEGILSTDQKTIFDLYWKAHWQQRMHHHSAA